MNDDELIERATYQWWHYCKAKGVEYRQPNVALCEVYDRDVKLANVDGVLVEYRYNQATDRLCMLKKYKIRKGTPC